LGVDSLDFLDLIFRINQQFEVDINPRDIERRTQALIGEPMLVEGAYTARAVEELRRVMPEVPAEEFYPGMPERQLLTSFRVKTFMNLVAFALDNADNGGDANGGGAG
jgi:hypothetical protein